MHRMITMHAHPYRHADRQIRLKIILCFIVSPVHRLIILI